MSTATSDILAGQDTEYIASFVALNADGTEIKVRICLLHTHIAHIQTILYSSQIKHFFL